MRYAAEVSAGTSHASVRASVQYRKKEMSGGA